MVMKVSVSVSSSKSNGVTFLDDSFQYSSPMNRSLFLFFDAIVARVKSKIHQLRLKYSIHT